MAFDGAVTKKIIYELNSCLIGGKVNKILQPNKNEIILGIYSGGKNFSLLVNVSSNCYRLHLTTSSKPNPLTPLNFCMVLRKHLTGFKIKSISNISLERVVTIEFEGYNELNDLTYKKLIIELMGKHSNVVLTNGNDVIIDSLKHFSNSMIETENIRQILPAHKYPVLKNIKADFYSTSFDIFKKVIGNSTAETDIVKQISNYYNGLSQNFIKGIYTSNIEELYHKIEQILKNLPTNAYCKLNDNEKDYFIDLSSDENKNSLQANNFLDIYYSSKEADDLFKSYKNNLLKIVFNNLNRLSKKLDGINKKLLECNDMDKYRIFGELITSNLYKFSSIDRFENIKLENYYDENKIVYITLDSSISPADNAKKFFKKYHKLKSTAEIVAVQKQEISSFLDYLESIVYELEVATTIGDLDEVYDEIKQNNVLSSNSSNNQIELSQIKKLDTSKTKKRNKKKITSSSLSSNSCTIDNLLTYNVDGFTFYVGKNNKQNDFISTKVGRNEDIWFHVKDFHGSHGILKCNGASKTLTEATLISCAKIVASHSKAKNSSNVPVDYCFVKYVKKPSGSKPGMVIFTHNKTLYVNP